MSATVAPDWNRLQKALSVEAERGFGNLMGREYRFNEFLHSRFSQPPELLPEGDRRRWQALASQFADYNTLSVSQRQHLVAESRRLLLQTQRSFEKAQREQQPPSDRVKTLKAPATAPLPSALADVYLSQPLTQVRGIGRRPGDRLAKLGLYTVEDLLHYFPRDRIDYARQVCIDDLEPGETVTVIAQVQYCNFFSSSKNKKLNIFQLTLKDPTGKLKISRFYPGHRYSSHRWQYAQKAQYPRGATVAASGLVKKNKYGVTLENPDLEVLDNPEGRIDSMTVGRVLPVYPLTEGVTADVVRRSVLAVLPACDRIQEPLPTKLRQKYDLMVRSQAVANIHFPPDTETLERARRRLVFDEFFYLQLGLLRRRHELRESGELAQQPASAALAAKGQLVDRFYEVLPFELTRAQKRVVSEILGDLTKTTPMNRLVQGDVGAGKTVVAVVAILAAVQSGYQAALMAPTEVLAEQHYRKLVNWLNLLQIPVELLTGSTKTAKRRQIYSQLKTGELPVVVGTHALIQDSVEFSRLGLAAIDEQHRFGVHQRARLQQKGSSGICHVLSMTATPIPRTLALTLHGDLDVSQIDELPPGRKPIQTTVLGGKERQQAYDLIRREVAQGRQAYVVLPLIEESEKLDWKSAVEEYDRLQDIFPNYGVGLLHGRMSSAQKEEAIEAFRVNQTQILVATTVVEVGVDVPNATVMLIENAERFGLSQLHQLRGRVGRGGDRSYCLLMTHAKASPDSKQRLEVLAQSQDGFFIAEMDMQLRGPGEVLGTRQSGLPDFVLASLVDDREVLILARDAAERVIAKDPTVERYPRMKRELEVRFARMLGGAVLQ